MKHVVGTAWLYAPFFKSKKFSEEKEWRLACSVSLGKMNKGYVPSFDLSNIDKRIHMEYAYSERNDNLVSHISLHHDSLSEYVSEIWLGPKCKLSYYEAKLFLISEGWIKDINDESIKIMRSDASYR